MKVKLSEFEVEELARHLFQLEEEDDLDAIDEALFDQWSIDFETFKAMLEHLVPLIEVGTSELTGNTYKGFAKDGLWLVKEEVPSVKGKTSK